MLPKHKRASTAATPSPSPPTAPTGYHQKAIFEKQMHPYIHASIRSIPFCSITFHGRGSKPWWRFTSQSHDQSWPVPSEMMWTTHGFWLVNVDPALHIEMMSWSWAPSSHWSSCWICSTCNRGRRSGSRTWLGGAAAVVLIKPGIRGPHGWQWQVKE